MSPQNLNAEYAVIGAVLIQQEAFDDIAGMIQAGDFTLTPLAQTWEGFEALSLAGEPLDILTLENWLRTHDRQPPEGGWMSYLGGLAKNTPSAANAKAYAQVVADRAKDRALLACAERMRLWVEDGTMNTQERLDRAQSEILTIGEQKAGTGPTPLRQILKLCIDNLDARFNRGGEIVGLSTGYVDLDRLTAGLHPGDLILLAARPSMGKTSLALNIAEHVGVDSELPVLLFSLEMSAEQLGDRLTSSVGGVPFTAIRTGQIADDGWPRITGAVGLMADAPLWIDDTAALSVMELRSRARRVARRSPLSLIVVDYLQLMRGARTENRNLEIAEISQGLKALAKELKVPVLALSQLNREVDKRIDKRPRPSDLRDSGSLEQDADLIMFLYRDEVYNRDSPQAGIAELIIGKQRNGPTGLVYLTWKPGLCKFENGMPPDNVSNMSPMRDRYSKGYE